MFTKNLEVNAKNVYELFQAKHDTVLSQNNKDIKNNCEVL